MLLNLLLSLLLLMLLLWWWCFVVFRLWFERVGLLGIGLLRAWWLSTINLSVLENEMHFVAVKFQDLKFSSDLGPDSPKLKLCYLLLIIFQGKTRLEE